VLGLPRNRHPFPDLGLELCRGGAGPAPPERLEQRCDHRRLLVGDALEEGLVPLENRLVGLLFGQRRILLDLHRPPAEDEIERVRLFWSDVRRRVE